MTTNKVHSLGHLAEMCGNDTTQDEARLVRDALIDRDLLEWFGDTHGGNMQTVTDDEFYAIVAAACATDLEGTSTTTNEQHLAAARHIAEGIAHDRIDEFDLEALRSDRGLEVGSVVVWHRVNDDRVIGWLGNVLDFDMTRIVEVPVPRKNLPSRVDNGQR